MAAGMEARPAELGIEVISKPIFGVILNQPKELKLGKNHPPFLKAIIYLLT